MIDLLEKQALGSKIVRIDADEIRCNLPGYTGSNAFLFQGAVSVAVDKLFDLVIGKERNFLLDGTFTGSKYRSNVERSIKHRRSVLIIYVYQDPINAWKITKQREKKDKRNIPKDVFIEELFRAYENVRKIKQEFGSRVSLVVLKRDYKTGKRAIDVDVVDLAEIIKISYSKDELNQLLK